jgi:hypothetical protein
VQTLREKGNSVLVDGGYEFAAPGTEADRQPQVVANLKRALELTGYDIFLMSPADATVFRNTGTAVPRSWTQPVDRPELIVKAVPGGSLAFVLFPDTGRPDPDLEKELTRFTRDLRQSGQFNLIVGVSTWGATRESAFIEGSEPVFDIVLGSGEGPGYPGLYLQGNNVLWLRAFTKGKSVLSVTIPELPAAGTKAVWDPEVNIRTQNLSLDDTVPSDPQIEAIFKP